MKKIYIGFSRPKSKWAIGSILIRFFEKSQFSHTFLKWTSESLNRDLIYHASHGMVHFVSGPRFDESTETVLQYSFNVTDVQHRLIVQKCIDLAGAKYGTWQLIGMGLERIFGFRNPWRDGDATYVCSELVGEIVKILDLELNLDLELIGPKKLAESLAELIKTDPKLQ